MVSQRVTFSVTAGGLRNGDMAECKVPDIEELKKVDGYLYLYENEITRRYSSLLLFVVDVQYTHTTW